MLFNCPKTAKTVDTMECLVMAAGWVGESVVKNFQG